MPLSPAQRRVLEDWMRSKAIVMCPCCGQAEEDLVEAAGVVKVPCDNCGYVALFDAETIGVRGLWAEGREL